MLLFSRTLSIALSASVWAAAIYLQRKFIFGHIKCALTICHCMPCGIVGHNHTLRLEEASKNILPKFIYFYMNKSPWEMLWLAKVESCVDLSSIFSFKLSLVNNSLHLWDSYSSSRAYVALKQNPFSPPHENQNQFLVFVSRVKVVCLTITT